MASAEDTLRAAYRAFNARDIAAAVELMHPEVDWPNAWEGGRVTGRDAVAAYWARQFEQILSTVTPEHFDHEPDGGIVVTVRQVVRDTKTNELQSDTHVLSADQARVGERGRLPLFYALLPGTDERPG